MNELIIKTMENLEKNNIKPYFVNNKNELIELVKTLINKEEIIASGGSVTLLETGILDLVKNGDYTYLDRNVPGLTKEKIENVYRETYKADTYFTSVNALTVDGALYNVDGNANRVSAFSNGPKSVIAIVGINKIVQDLDEAVFRVKTVAAPLNVKRLNLNTPCSKLNKCISLVDNDNPPMQSGCHCDDRICCTYNIYGSQRHKNRIKVIIVNETLGY